ncbi:hypothetical protein ACA506_004493 [Vibrio parahaemolyticus]
MTQFTKVNPDVEPASDKLYRLAEAAVSIVPTGQTVLHSLISPPIHKRMEKWMSEVENKLIELEQASKLSFLELQSDPKFSALFLRAVQTAASTSQPEKLDFLKNFIVNISLQPDISEDELYLLFNIISEFTPSHIRLVQFYSNPNLYSCRLNSIPTEASNDNTTQGRELAVVFENGDVEYWQNIFWAASGRHVVTNISQSVANKSAIGNVVVSGNVTNLGRKLLALVELETYS